MAAVQRTVEVYGTSVLSTTKLRSNHESVQRILQGAKVPFTFYDIGSDEAAKATFKRKNGGNTEMPLVLSGGERVGTVEQLQEAAEFGEVKQFLKLDEPAGQASDDALLASLSATDARALAAELDGPSARASAAVTASSDASKGSAAAAAAAAGAAETERPVEPVHTPATGGTVPIGSAEADVPETAGAVEEEDEEEEDVPIKPFGGLVPKDEVALKREAREKEEQASLPTVPSGDQLAAAIEDDPEPAVVKDNGLS